MMDTYGVSQASILLPTAIYTADNTPGEVSIAGFRSALIILSVGVGGITFTGANKIEFKLTHGDTPGGSFTAVEQRDVSGVTVGAGGIIRALTAAHAAATVQRIGYVGGKRIIRLLAEFSGTHGVGTPISASAVLQNPHISPV